MTQKDIIKMASDSYIRLWMSEIADAQDNMCYKTEYEQKSEMQRIKRMSKYIIERLEDLKKEG